MNREFGSGGALLSSEFKGLFDRDSFFFEGQSLGVAQGGSAVTAQPRHPDIRSLDLGVSLLELGWPTQDQDLRNTCTAFCVAAAAEVTHFHANSAGTVPKYSEELLYSMISAVKYRDVVKDVNDDEIERFDRTGARFLAQARAALQRGALVPSEELSYDLNLPIDEDKALTTSLQNQAANSVVAGTINNIVTKTSDVLLVGPGRPWELSHDTSTVSTVFPQTNVDVVNKFIGLLQARKAVAAAFPLLAGADRDIWFGSKTLETGHVRYPGRGHFDKMDINGGHAVCIVGYETSKSDPGEGFFIFRNSFGRRFGWRPESNPHYSGLRKGYGTISFHDVKWFCLEYLHLWSPEPLHDEPAGARVLLPGLLHHANRAS